MGLNTGGSTQTQAVAPAEGLSQLSAPNSLYNLTPAENTFVQGIMGASLPGSMLSQAQGYTSPGGPAGSYFQLNPAATEQYNNGVQGLRLLTDPSMGLFGKYLDQIVGPQVRNNAIASGYGGSSGAAMEAMSRAGTDAALRYASLYPSLVHEGIQLGQLPTMLQLQGLTSLGLPLAQNDYTRLGTGLGAAGLQRQSSLADLARIQALLQSLSGKTVTQTNTGPGTAASLLNLGASALLGGGGSSGSLLNQLLSPAVSGAGNALGSLFSGSPGGVVSGASDLTSGLLNLGSTSVPESIDAASSLLGGIFGGLF